MTPLKPSAFPVLHRAFAAYLHEDFLEEYATPAAALRAFLQDAAPPERARFVKESKRFVARTAAFDFNEVLALLAHLGCRWAPPSREALVALFADVTDPLPDVHRT
jgi:hypothetical protein